MALFIISHDGAPVGAVDGNEALGGLEWFAANCRAYSMDHAVRHEGYSVEKVDEPDDAAALLEAIAKRATISMTAEFVPLSRARRTEGVDGKPWRSINWSVRLSIFGREILTSDYSQGIAYAPAYKLSVPHDWKENAIAHELERGTIHTVRDGGFYASARTRDTRKPLPAPALSDVLHSLAMDASALDDPDFTAWAESVGYDPDSRKAEAIYRACIETATKLRAHLGQPLLNEIRTVAGYL
jgi:hypothetical protein